MIKVDFPSADGTVLAGRHWPVDTPKAVMTLIHGFGEHCGRYAHMAAHLNANDIAVVSADLRGHGNTLGPRGIVRSYDDFRADLAAIMAQAQSLYPNVPHILYGHSMGGGIVLDYGLRSLDNLPIIASAPFITPTKKISTPLRFIVNLLAKIRPKGGMTQPIDGGKISNLPEEQSLYLNDPLNHGRIGFHLAKGMVETGEHISRIAKSWDRPLLLIHSTADQLTDFESSACFSRAANQVDFHAFDTVQHEMHNDATRDEVYALMTDFILKHAELATS